MVRSMINPDIIWLRKTELTDDGLFLILRVRTNIKQVTVEDMKEGGHTEYEYDEEEVRYPVPDGVTSAAGIQNLLSTEAANIIQKATRVMVWKEIHTQPIEELRQTIKEL